jgi:N-acetyl-gamma-glutamyl-phosphate reductase
VLIAGATGFAGALAAHLLWRHPRFELIGITGRSEVGRRLDELYPRHRVPLRIEQLDLDVLAIERNAGRPLDAAIVAYPHGAAAGHPGKVIVLSDRKSVV